LKTLGKKYYKYEMSVVEEPERNEWKAQLNKLLIFKNA
jgi:hypothetical protein